MTHKGILFLVGRFDEVRIKKIVSAHLHTFLPVVIGKRFNFYHKILHPRDVRILEYGVEANHSALAELMVILDVEKGEASRVFPEEFDRICLAHHRPIDIHLKINFVYVDKKNGSKGFRKSILEDCGAYANLLM